MSKGRLEAFSDGVIAIIITIMVLELKVPDGASLEDLRHTLPHFASYVLSFVYLGIYWNNHHHMLHSVRRVNGTILWANMHLLFWLSLVPFVTGWIGDTHLATTPTVAYGVVMLLAAISYYILQQVILRVEGPDSFLARALGPDVKGRLSPVLYLLSIPAAFINPWISAAIFVTVALIWLVPDSRIERAMQEHHPAG